MTAAIVLVMALVVRQWIFRGQPTKSPAVGKAFESLELTPLEGDGPKLSAQQLDGKVTLLNFWGPWCPPCRMEFPELMDLRERLAKEEKFQLLSVTCMHDANEGDLVPQTKSFLTSKKFELPVYRDPGMVTRGEVLRLMEDNGFAYPTTLLIDQQGIVRGVWVGYSPGIGERMRGQIAELLAARPRQGAEGSAP